MSRSACLGIFQTCSQLTEWIRNDSPLPMARRCAMEARRFGIQRSRADSYAMPADGMEACILANRPNNLIC